jgi:hypothetical protein
MCKTSNSLENKRKVIHSLKIQHGTMRFRLLHVVSK